MAQRSKSGRKRIKTSAKRKARNISAKQAVKNAFKAADRAIAAKSSDVEGSIKKAFSIIDKAVARGILHKNKAARKKSRLMKKIVK
jgi:small subunit ribosomal protein S20